MSEYKEFTTNKNYRYDEPETNGKTFNKFTGKKISLKDVKETHHHLVLETFNRQAFKNENDDEKLILAIEKINDRVYVKTGIYIGHFYFDIFSFWIKPNIGDDSFLCRMLNYVNNIFIDTNKKIDFNSKESEDFLFEYLFLTALQKASVLGFPKEYSKKQVHGLQVQGEVNLKKYIKDNIPFKGKFSFIKDERIYVQPIIDIIYYALKICKKSKIAGHFHHLLAIEKELKNVATQSFPSVVKMKEAINHKSLHNPMFREYKKVLHYAQLVIEKYNSVAKKDRKSKTDVLGFLLDVSALWEAYLLAILKRAFPTWDVTGQKELNLYSETFFRRSNYPDIVMEKENKVIIFDAKFKKMNFRNGDVDREDLFQIQSYAGYFQQAGKDVILCGLLYPFESKLDINDCHTNLYGLIQPTVPKFIIDGIYCKKNEDENMGESEKQFVERIKQYVQIS